MPRTTLTTTRPALSRSALYSSASDNWPTPQTFFDALHAEFGLVVDVCADAANRKAPAYYGLDHVDPSRRDGLAGDWAADAQAAGGAVWMNPPYGKAIGAWMAKAAATAQAGAVVVTLVPVRADTAWWHEHVLDTGAEVRFVRGRLTFGNAVNTATFASAVVIYRPSDVLGQPGPVGTIARTVTASATRVARRPQRDVQDVLQSRDGDQVRPRPAGEQVLDGASRQPGTAAGSGQAPPRERLAQRTGHRAGHTGSNGSSRYHPAVGERTRDVVRRPPQPHRPASHDADATAPVEPSAGATQTPTTPARPKRHTLDTNTCSMKVRSAMNPNTERRQPEPRDPWQDGINSRSAEICRRLTTLYGAPQDVTWSLSDTMWTTAEVVHELGLPKPGRHQAARQQLACFAAIYGRYFYPAGWTLQPEADLTDRLTWTDGAGHRLVDVLRCGHSDTPLLLGDEQTQLTDLVRDGARVRLLNLAAPAESRELAMTVPAPAFPTCLSSQHASLRSA